MKPSHFAAMMTAAILGGASAHQSTPEFQLRVKYPEDDAPPKSGPIMPGRSRRKAKAPMSQRQTRKARRRAHAAGKRNAFR